MKLATLKAPFPAFGGKSRVAALVWERLGDVPNYIEPFANSAAVLLARPHEPKIETVNDLDCYIANFWRATQQDPEAVALYADNPVNEADLHARHRWLVLSLDAFTFRARMRTDPDYFDARIAGWWVQGLCSWIGGGWCSSGPEEMALGDRNWVNTQNVPWNGKGVNSGNSGKPKKKRPKLTSGTPGSGALGTGVNANGPHIKRPCIGGGSHGNKTGNARGVNGSARPQLADAYDIGRGVNSNGDVGTCEARLQWLIEWFGQLRDRLRLTRVCCGHWLRVCDSPSVTTRLGATGIFLDPPYPTHNDGEESRSGGLYATGDRKDELDTLRDEVLAYCLERGSDKDYRIAVCGYDTDGYSKLEEHGWEVVAWKASGGYGNRSDTGKENAKRERIWFSPNCVKPGGSLFE